LTPERLSSRANAAQSGSACRRRPDLTPARANILAALLALLAAAFVKFAGPAKFAYGFISNKP
jgi:hypothetical protein